MNWINGRPEDWVNPHKDAIEKYPQFVSNFNQVGQWADIYEAGASKMLKALLKWLKQYQKEKCLLIDKRGKPTPALEFIIPEKDLKEMEGE